MSARRFAFAVAAVTLLVVTPGSAHVNFGGYDHKDDSSCGPASRQDPITVQFTQGAIYQTFFSAVGNSIAVHLNWASSSPNNEPWSVSYGYSHVCKAPSGVNIGGEFWGDRWHVRHYSNYDWDSTWGTVAYGTPHYDVRCFPTGHAAGSYIGGRTRIINNYTYYGHANQGTWWKGNTATVTQCNGSVSGADGYVTRITQHSSGHA